MLKNIEIQKRIVPIITEREKAQTRERENQYPRMIHHHLLLKRALLKEHELHLMEKNRMIPIFSADLKVAELIWKKFLIIPEGMTGGTAG